MRSRSSTSYRCGEPVWAENIPFEHGHEAASDVGGMALEYPRDPVKATMPVSGQLVGKTADFCIIIQNFRLPHRDSRGIIQYHGLFGGVHTWILEADRF